MVAQGSIGISNVSGCSILVQSLRLRGSSACYRVAYKLTFSFCSGIGLSHANSGLMAWLRIWVWGFLTFRSPVQGAYKVGASRVWGNIIL